MRIRFSISGASGGYYHPQGKQYKKFVLRFVQTGLVEPLIEGFALAGLLQQRSRMVNLSGWAINELPKWIVFVSGRVQVMVPICLRTPRRGRGLILQLFCSSPREHGWVSISPCSYTSSTSFNPQRDSST